MPALQRTGALESQVEGGACVQALRSEQMWDVQGHERVIVAGKREKEAQDELNKDHMKVGSYMDL